MEGRFVISMYVSKILICTVCGEEFVFTADAQQYLAEKGFINDPKRCKSCHIKSKQLHRQNKYHNNGTPIPHITITEQQKNIDLPKE